MLQTPIGASEYYDVLPSSDHQPGDIWLGFPTHGVLPKSHVTAIVVTPACDLANRKVETITYLPVISVEDYLCSRSFLPEILRYTEGQLEAGGMQIRIQSPHISLPPGVQDLTAALSLLQQETQGKRLGKKEEDAVRRARIGLAILKAVVSGERHVGGATDVGELLGKREYQILLRRIVTNGYRPDVHFLPYDQQPVEWSAVPAHGVALFRYPMSIPLDILDLALVSTSDSWGANLRSLLPMHPCAADLADALPIKVLRVRPHFMSDLLTRFTGLYGRLGSPDFSSTTVDRFMREIG